MGTLYYFQKVLQGYFSILLCVPVLVEQCYFAHRHDDNIAHSGTLHVLHKVSFWVLENSFRLDWAATFPCTAERKDPTPTFFNIYGLFDATQGQSRCSSCTSQIAELFESQNIFWAVLKSLFSAQRQPVTEKRSGFQAFYFYFRDKSVSSKLRGWMFYCFEIDTLHLI